MILCLDVGNTQIFGGVYNESSNKLIFTFRKFSSAQTSSDEFGLFLVNVLRENGVKRDEIAQVAICSVVPDMVFSLNKSCINYFNVNPFLLGPGVKTGLKIKYRNPLEVGADRIANSIAAMNRFPSKNIIIVDFGTATTFCAITKEKEYLGGAIIPGPKISMQVLENKTAKLPKVEIVKAVDVCGRSTVESIQAGLYFGQLGMIKEITGRMIKECFKSEECLIIGTGGFSSLFTSENVFNEIVPNLVLDGIYQSLKINQ